MKNITILIVCLFFSVFTVGFAIGFPNVNDSIYGLGVAMLFWCGMFAPAFNIKLK